MEAMDDDFNTPNAIAVLFDLANKINKTRSLHDSALLKALGGLLGLLQQDPQQHLRGKIMDNESVRLSEFIEDMIQQRLAARAAKNFIEADRIRKELLSLGIILEDGQKITTWRRN